MAAFLGVLPAPVYQPARRAWTMSVDPAVINQHWFGFVLVGLCAAIVTAAATRLVVHRRAVDAGGEGRWPVLLATASLLLFLATTSGIVVAMMREWVSR